MTKAVIGKTKGKVPKSNKKLVRDKSRQVLQRRVQLPLRELRKVVREKIGKSRKGKAKFPFGDSVGKAVSCHKQSNNILAKEGTFANLGDDLDLKTFTHGPTCQITQGRCLCG